MPTSTITSKGQTTVPKEIREVLDVGPGDRLTWEVRGGKVAITAEEGESDERSVVIDRDALPT
jgi:antitoxin PrlF